MRRTRPRAEIRKIARIASWAIEPLVAALVVSCASPPDTGLPQPPETAATSTSLGKTALSKADLRELPGLAPAARRARLDTVLAAHPGDVAARFFRAEADEDLHDFDAMLADGDAVLAEASLDRRVRLRLLDARAEALLQLQRPADAVAPASQALQLDASDPYALFARGWASYLSDHGTADSALSDLDRALQLKPDVGIGFYRRAVIYADQGKFELAASNLDRAAVLAPDDKPIRRFYGLMWFMQWFSGRDGPSLDAFRKHAASPDASDDAPLWLFLMRMRASPAEEAAARAELATLAPASRPPAWRDTLVALMLGRTTLPAALAEADAADTERLRAGRRCEADYYAAEQLLARGEDAGANRLLEAARAVCPPSYVEFEAVAAEQRRQASRAATR